MPKIQSNSQPPPIMPGLGLVPTGKTVVENGKRYVILKLEREPRSDVSYNIKRKEHATRPQRNF